MAIVIILKLLKMTLNASGHEKYFFISPSDIDECSSEELNRCDEQCMNKVGGYECNCSADGSALLSYPIADGRYQAHTENGNESWNIFRYNETCVRKCFIY